MHNYIFTVQGTLLFFLLGQHFPTITRTLPTLIGLLYDPKKTTKVIRSYLSLYGPDSNIIVRKLPALRTFRDGIPLVSH
jgi:hypothetical protein